MDWYEDIVHIIRQHKGKINFHDALIILSAKELKISRIASFDKDFDTIKSLERIC